MSAISVLSQFIHGCQPYMLVVQLVSYCHICLQHGFLCNKQNWHSLTIVRDGYYKHCARTLSLSHLSFYQCAVELVSMKQDQNLMKKFREIDD